MNYDEAQGDKGVDTTSPYAVDGQLGIVFGPEVFPVTEEQDKRDQGQDAHERDSRPAPAAIKNLSHVCSLSKSN
jgi:hypothetical protein